MVSHTWGDEDFDWESLDKAINYVVDFNRRWSRLPVHGKEKWGSMRLECVFWGFSLVWLLWPGYMFKPKNCPSWLFHLDQNLAYKWPVYRLLINWWFIPYQMWIFKLSHTRACKKWPHIKEEIMDEADLY